MRKSTASSIVEISKKMGIESAMDTIEGFIALKEAKTDFLGKKKRITFKSDNSTLIVNKDGSINASNYQIRYDDAPVEKIGALPGAFIGNLDKDIRERKRREFIAKNHKKNGTQPRTKFRRKHDVNPSKDPSRYALDIVNNKGRAFAALNMLKLNPNDALKSLARMSNSGEVVRHEIGARTLWIFSDFTFLFRDNWTRKFEAFSSMEEMERKRVGKQEK